MNRRNRLAPLVILVAFALTPHLAQAQSSASQKRPLSLDDLAKVRSVNDPQLSPDGKWVAYTVGTVDTEKDKRNTDVWMTSWDGAEQVRLTSTPDGESRPRWSRDGRYLAFLASRGAEEEKKKGSQVWLLNRAGGEAEKLTDVNGGVNDYAWSPLDSHLRTPLSANLLDHPNGLWIATGSYPDPERQAALESAGARILHLPLGEDGNLDMLLLLECLRAKGIRRVMVEGGARVITAFLQQGLADLLFLTIAPLFVGGYHALQSGALRAHGQKRLVQPGYAILGEDLIVWGELS